MKINKQLFEDVLSGKLKGTFIRKDGIKLNSSLLVCGGHIDNRVYAIGTDMYYIYYDDGVVHKFPYEPNLDIIDFIPNTNIKEELTIEIPDGKIVDWEESKRQNKIVLKDKQLTYEEICDRLPEMIDIPLFETPSKDGNALVANEHYLECLLAKNMLANVAKYLNDGWKPNKSSDIYYINNYHGNLVVYLIKEEIGLYDGQIIFKSKELAQQSIEILGEETVKLALEPLGI